MPMVKGYKGLYAFGILMSPQHILRKMKAGTFPPCRKDGNVCWWRREDIEHWIRNLPIPPTLSRNGE